LENNPTQGIPPWEVLPKQLKKGVLFLLEFDIDAILFGVFIGNRLDGCKLGVLPLGLEEVSEPLLGL